MSEYAGARARARTRALVGDELVARGVFQSARPVGASERASAGPSALSAVLFARSAAAGGGRAAGRRSFLCPRATPPNGRGRTADGGRRTAVRRALRSRSRAVWLQRSAAGNPRPPGWSGQLARSGGSLPCGTSAHARSP